MSYGEASVVLLSFIAAVACWVTLLVRMWRELLDAAEDEED